MEVSAPASSDRVESGGPQATLDLPTDRPRRPEPTGSRGRASLGFDLRAGTDAATLAAAFASLLHRYTNEEKVSLGFVEPDESPRLVQLDFEGAPSFEAVVDQARAAIEESDAGALPQVMLSLDSEPPDGQVDQDLWLAVERNGGSSELSLLLDYDADLYELETAERLLGHVRTLLEAGLREPATLVAELPLLDQRERELVLGEWNDTAAAYPGTCVDELVSEQARRTPEAIAVVCGGEQLTFAELDRRATCLGRYLRTLGVGPDVLVGIAVERSVELLVGLLGILKAGGAYVPIDPDYPVDRQSYMLEDAAVGVVVTQERLLGKVPLGRARAVCLDRDWAEVERAPEPALTIDRNPEQLAYAIYTSGSTGLPKGVEIPHRALANFLWTMRERPGLGPDDVLVAVTTLSFDIAGLELYLPLVVGGRLVIAPSQTASDPRLLSALLAESSATVMQATPTTWRMLLDSGWRGAPGLRALCGGEALPVALAEELVDCGIELWNMYGPTETTIWSTVARVHTGEPLTIGRPIGNTSLYILDSRLQPLPAGVAGELHIGGDGVARGYRNRPDLTEERFLANPFGEGRIYKTGDLARYRRDGSVEYLGRLDHQVKVRGFRIELGEIETLLARNDGVTRAVCVARDDGNGPELVAYIVPSGIPVSSAHLRRYLAEHLPPYMVPSAIVSLQEFPLTLNGKVDRKALPAPTRERQTEEEIVPPRTPLERRLAEIWKRVLGVSQISVTDNFFDLGASSIVAAQLFAEIEHELGRRAAARCRLPWADDRGARQPDRDGRRCLALDVARADPAARHAAADLLRARRRRDDPSSRAARAPARARPAAVRAAVARAVRRGIAAADRRGDGVALPLRDPPGSAVGPYAFAGYCFGAIVAFEMAQRMLAEGEEVRLRRIVQRAEPGLDQALGLVREPAVAPPLCARRGRG